MILVLMGVSGCGKSTVAGVLAGRLGWPFEEGDDMHPPANVAKMHARHPLTDEDRAPWLRQLRAWMDERERAGENGILTCSALKRRYRDVLRDGQVTFVYLAGSRELLLSRLQARQGHFMPVVLLDSQLADLEPPGDDERALRIDIGPSAATEAAEILEALAL